MQGKEVTVRLSALDGTWEIGGVDRKAGIVPENVSLTVDLWGPATASFDMRRDPRAIWPDLGAYTPVEVEIGGKVVWAGRISSTPTRDSTDRVISVQAAGWQYHLDDDLYERVYVHTRLSDWRDLRSFVDTDLTATGYTSAWQVTTDSGTIHIGVPTGSSVPQRWGGVGLDLGPSSTARRIVLKAKGGGRANFALYVQASAVKASGGDLLSASQASTVPTSDTVYSGTIPAGARYVNVIASNDSGGTLTGDDTTWIQLSSIQVFTDTAYESGNASILKASDVITDALAKATVLLSADRSGITVTSFSIPDFALGAPATPREAWSAVNAYHDYLAQIDVSKRPVFRAKPTVPMFEVGSWSPLELEDQSANSGDDIYSRVIVTGTQPDGSPLRVTRDSAVVANTFSSISNPVVSSSAISASGTTSPLTTTAFPFTSGTFLAGRSYRLTWAISLLVPFGSGKEGSLTLNVPNGTVTYLSNPGVGASGDASAAWSPTVDTPAASVSVTVEMDWSSGTGTKTVSASNLRLGVGAATLVDRRSFRRSKALPVNSALTPAAAQQIGDLWLASHRTTPYKGSFKLTGDQAMRDPTTGTYLPLESLLLHTGELIRDTNAIDPDTGGIGRDGRIAQVTYTPATENAVVTLDNSRASFEALLSRFDLLSSVGQ